MFKRLIILAVFAYFFATLGLPVVNYAWAVEVEPPRIKLNVPIPGLEEFSQGEGVAVDNASFVKYVGGLFKFFVGVAGIITVFMIMYGGVQWIFSGGNPAKISSAKETILGAVTGLLLALCSYSLLYVINPSLVHLRPLGLTMVPYIEDSGLDCSGVSNSATGCNVVPVDTANITGAGSHVILSLQNSAAEGFNGLMAAWKNHADNPDAKIPRINSMFRSYDYQNCLHSQNPEIANEAGLSTHEKGLAFDLNTQSLTANEYYAFVNLASEHAYKCDNPSFGQSESWHFTYQQGINDLCVICPSIDFCSAEPWVIPSKI